MRESPARCDGLLGWEAGHRDLQDLREVPIEQRDVRRRLGARRLGLGRRAAVDEKNDGQGALTTDGGAAAIRRSDRSRSLRRRIGRCEHRVAKGAVRIRYRGASRRNRSAAFTILVHAPAAHGAPEDPMHRAMLVYAQAIAVSA
jgi:hypothetical protein